MPEIKYILSKDQRLLLMTFHSQCRLKQRPLHLEPAVIILCSLYGAIGLIFVLWISGGITSQSTPPLQFPLSSNKRPKGKKKRKLAGRMTTIFYEIKLSNPSQFAGQLITICQAVHLIIRSAKPKANDHIQPTNATVVIATWQAPIIYVTYFT